MPAENYVKQIINFQKATFENSFNAASMMQDQAERVFQSALIQVPWMPAEQKKVMEEWVGLFKQGRENFRRSVHENFDKMAEYFEKIPSPPAPEMKASSKQSKT